VTDLILGAVCIGQMATIALVLRTQSAERRRLLNGIVSKTPQEFAMLEKATQRATLKHKPAPAPIPFGL
jgi:hypothetical protein